MIDFTGMPTLHKAYGGANGKKISIVYNNEIYMLKFPAVSVKKAGDTNSCVCEYLGCRIFQSVGVPVQEVLLGTYTTSRGRKVVVACKDFTSQGVVLQDFISIKNQIIDSEYNGCKTELSGILDIFDKQSAIDREELSQRFWNMFIVDALIGNWDRHNGNWGFLYNTAADELSLAPVYDCGSCLFSQADMTVIESILSDKNKLNDRVYNRPTSAITVNGKRINYFDFISSCDNKECNKALKRIFPKIDITHIENIIDEILLLNDSQKQFYKVIVKQRYEHILRYSYYKIFGK